MASLCQSIWCFICNNVLHSTFKRISTVYYSIIDNPAILNKVSSNVNKVSYNVNTGWIRNNVCRIKQLLKNGTPGWGVVETKPGRKPTARGRPSPIAVGQSAMDLPVPRPLARQQPPDRGPVGRPQPPQHFRWSFVLGVCHASGFYF